MHINPLTSGRLGIALVIAFQIATSSQSPAQDNPPKSSPPKTTVKSKTIKERASGVIVKVEKTTPTGASTDASKKEPDNGKARPSSFRLTINTNAVWRDWVRDQTKVKDSGPPSKDAKAGAGSVATKGEPADANSLVVVDVTADTRVETRFRTPDDETSKGSRTPEGAREEASGKSSKTVAAKPVHFERDDLKPGLFVEADFKHVSAKNPASTVTVIRPISALEPSPAK